MSALPHRRPTASLACAAVMTSVIMFGATAARADAGNFTLYTSAASFTAAATSLVSYTFPSGGTGSTLPSPYTIGPENFGSTQHIVRPHLMDDGFYGAGQTYLSMQGPINGVSAGVQSSAADGVYSIAFDIGTRDGADTLTIKLNTTDVIGTFSTFTAGTSTFIGITSLVPITQVNFTATTGSEIDFLDVQVGGPVAAVPEPSSEALAFAGLAALGAFVRRRKAG